MRYYLKYALLLYLVSYGTGAGAQKKNPVLEKFRAANTDLNLCYDYKVVLRNMKSGKNVDSVQGSLYCKDGNYIDSNTRSYTARSGHYFCRLDHTDKTAAVYDMRTLSRETGIRFEHDEKNVLFNLSDSLIARQGGKALLDSANRTYYRYKVRLRNYPVSYMQIDFRKDNGKMLAAYLESEERDGNDPDHFYVTRYFLYNVRHRLDDRIFDLSRVFTNAAGKTVLSSKYSKYTLHH